MKIAVYGAGAFGTALAISLAATNNQVTLIGRDAAAMTAMEADRTTPRLPDVSLPGALRITHATSALAEADIVLLASPAQTLGTVLLDHRDGLTGKCLVACCKGIDLNTLTGPSEVITTALPTATPAILTGPSFAADIARGLPTALTLACADADTGAWLQSVLSSATVRLYRSADMIGAQLGGALKNVMAIACGATIGAGLGDSARAALMTRGFVEMQRLAQTLGAQPDTLQGLSGLGDLALTCTSDLSRNFRYGQALGAGTKWDVATTVEGAATAQAAAQLANQHGLDLPITQTVAQLVTQAITLDDALITLLSRPLKEE